MSDWTYDICDAKYNNLKRWFEGMAKKHPMGLNSVVLLDKIIGDNGMFDYLDKTQDKIDNIVFEEIMKTYDESKQGELK